VRDEARKAEVLAKVGAAAEREAAPRERVVQLYEALIESSIALRILAWFSRKCSIEASR